MAALGGLAIGLTVVFGVFLLVLLAELYYLFYWKCRSPWNMRRITSVATEFTEGAFNFSREDGLVGSLGSHSIRESADPESLAKLFPLSNSELNNNSLYMQEELGGSRVLFTIIEETKEDMDGEESVSDHKSTFSGCPSRSGSPSPNHLERRFQQQQKQLQRDAFSIGLIPQQLWDQQQQDWQESRHWMATSPSLEPMNYSELPAQYSCSPSSSPSRLASLRPPSPSSPISSPWRTNYESSLPASARKESQHQSFYAVISNPMYDSRKIWSLPTDPFGTHVSSPSLLDTPPLTPMRAPLAAYSVSGISFLRNPAGSSDSSPSSKCSSSSLY